VWTRLIESSFLSPPPPLRCLDLSRFLPFLALSICNFAYLFFFCHHYGSQARACVLVFCLKGPRALSSCISSEQQECCISTVHARIQWYFFVVTQDVIIITGDIIMITVIIIITKTLCQGDPFVWFLYLWSPAFCWNFERIALQIPFFLENKYMKCITQKDRKHTLLLATNVPASLIM